jgi:FdhD protein
MAREGRFRRPRDLENWEESVRSVPAVRWSGKARAARDLVVREEPLEIRLGGLPLAVTMRTPGADEELVTGWLLTERIVGAPSEIASVGPCSAGGGEGSENTIRVTLAPGAKVDFERLRRNLYASSSCGICGKATIENALRSASPLQNDTSRFAATFFPPLVPRLAAAQDLFGLTGGLHAAGLFAPDGRLLAVREDVGRHNALDKAIGWAIREGRFPLPGHVLVVSGRISYEIVQKALVARIPVVAAVSAPSSLAVELAARARMTLIGFLRGPRFNVYGDKRRVVPL